MIPYLSGVFLLEFNFTLSTYMKSEKNFSMFLPRRHKDTKFHEDLPHRFFSDFIMSDKVDKVKLKVIKKNKNVQRIFIKFYNYLNQINGDLA